MQGIMESKYIELIFALATLYALYSDDIRVLAVEKVFFLF